MTRTTRILRASPDTIAMSAGILVGGGLVAFPTETVYGLGADATNGRAVAGIYDAKGRPSFNPLIAHVVDAEAAGREGAFSADAERLAGAFWPGPMTLVLPKAPGCSVSDIALAGLDSVALRVPAHPVAQAVLAAVGRPVAAPSANRSGHVSPTTAAHVAHDLDGRIDAILDGGPTHVGVESTILACLGDRVRLLRPGGVTREEIEAILDAPLDLEPVDAGDNPMAPGMMASHYAPKARVRLDAVAAQPGEAWLAFGAGSAARARGPMRDLSPTGDLAEAAANLFGMLRDLDACGTGAIAVAPIPAEGLGEAIRDRLARAAAGR
jgi:L-threonylcarbamoyladenylate synthase